MATTKDKPDHTSLWSLTSQLEALHAHIEAAGGELASADLAALETAWEALTVKGDGCKLYDVSLKGRATQLKAFEEEARTRRKAVEALRERYHDYLGRCLERLGGKIDGDAFAVKWAKCPPAVEWVDGEVVPARCLETDMIVPGEQRDGWTYDVVSDDSGEARIVRSRPSRDEAKGYLGARLLNEPEPLPDGTVLLARAPGARLVQRRRVAL